nr:periplakin isoform X2 [Danaus plexippus plexippus]
MENHEFSTTLLSILEGSEGIDMRSLWTKVRIFRDTKADAQEQKPESPQVGDGEQITNKLNSAAPENKQEDLVGQTEVPEQGKKPDVTESRVEAKPEPSKPEESADWQKREQDLLKKIEELEKVKSERSIDGLMLELKVREEEIDLLKARVKNLETELQAALSKPGGKNQEVIEKIKQQHEELLSKAKGMIFDKTKMVKNQELQIEALSTQVQSLKDINQITKDLLEIRNSEVKAMEDRFQALESRFKGEKERYDLVLKRAQTSSNINDDLRKEYETQLAIFKELREKYELRVKALVEENNRLKASVKGGPSG